MSLQGTLDTFPLPDVLRLLAATRKSGLLRVEVARGTGRVWFADGELSAIAAPDGGAAAPAAPTGEALFELLRCRDGAFTFDAGAASPEEGRATSLEPVLDRASTLVEEWREIEAVVPSLRSTLRLSAELPGPEATVTAAQWLLLVAIGSGTTVGDLGSDQGLGELAVSRTVKGLVEAGLAAVGAPLEPAPAPPAEALEAEEGPEGAETEEVGDAAPAEEPKADATAPAAPVAAPRPAPQPAAAHGTVSVGGFTRRPLGARPAGTRPAGPSTLGASLAELSSPDRGRRPSAPPPGDDAVDEHAEVARTLAELGPEAEAAVAAAAGAATPEERDAALDAIAPGPDGEPVNRGALLKFLSSVRS